MPLDVLLVVITHNSAHVVTDLLDSVPAATADLRYEVIVVDNASTDGTAELLDARSDCLVVRSSNVGYAGGLGVGVAHADPAETILVLNPDVRLDAESVKRLHQAVLAPGVGIAAPRVLSVDGALHHSLRRDPTILRAVGLNRTGLRVFSEYVSDPEDYERSHDVDWALGAVLLMTRACYDALGGWDASYFLYSEETDFCLRARDAGYATRYVPDAVVRHIGAQSGQSPRIHTMQILNRVRLYRRRHGLGPSAIYYGATILSESLWVLRGHRAQSSAAIAALVRPSRRPAELATSDRLIPR